MSNLPVRRIFRNRYARWLFFGSAFSAFLGLCIICALARRERAPGWPKSANFNWSRDLDLTYAAAKRENAFTVGEISYINGKLSAGCAFRNIDPNHGVLLHGVVDVYGGFWPNVRLEATGEFPPRWTTIGKSPEVSGKAETKTVTPGQAIVVNVDLDPCRAVIRKYRYARLVTETGASGVVALKHLLPPCENWPPGIDCLPTPPEPELFPVE